MGPVPTALTVTSIAGELRSGGLRASRRSSYETRIMRSPPGRDRARVSPEDVVELATGMCPAGDGHNGARLAVRFVKALEPGRGIGLRDAGERLRMPARALALAGRSLRRRRRRRPPRAGSGRGCAIPAHHPRHRPTSPIGAAVPIVIMTRSAPGVVIWSRSRSLWREIALAPLLARSEGWRIVRSCGPLRTSSPRWMGSAGEMQRMRGVDAGGPRRHRGRSWSRPFAGRPARPSVCPRTPQPGC
jgi:hypothetical protein